MPGTAAAPLSSPEPRCASARRPPAWTPAPAGCSGPGHEQSPPPLGVAGSVVRGPCSAQVVPQGVGALGIAELGHRLALDLADPLAGEAEALADLLEGARLLAVQSEPHDHDVALALIEGLQDVADVALHHLEGDG